MFKKFLSLFLIIIISSGAAGEWDNAAFMNVARAGASAVSWDGKIYVFGGKSSNNKILNTVEIYDPQFNVWDSSSAKSFEHARYNAAAIVWENKIYLIGGRTIDEVMSVVEVYDPVQNVWQEAHDLRQEREGHSVSIFNNRLYTIGGQKSSFNLIDDIEWYDDIEEEWKDATFELENPRAAHFSAVYNDRFYMFGGYYYGLKSTGFTAVPDIDSGFVWQELPELIEPRAYGATAVMDSLIFMIGGETATGKTDLVEIYDAKNNTIKMGERMIMSHSGMACAVIDSTIYTMGGYESSANEPVNHVHIYRPTITALPEINNLPQNFILTKAYPNPFNGSIKIEVSISTTNDIEIDIVNALGQNIRKISKPSAAPGKNTFLWDGRDNTGNNLPSGIYFARIQLSSAVKLLKLVYVK